MKKTRIRSIILLAIVVLSMIITTFIFQKRINYSIGGFFDCIGKKDTANIYYKKVIEYDNVDDLTLNAGIKKLENIIDEYNFDYFSCANLSAKIQMIDGVNLSLEELQKINKEYSRIKNSLEENDSLALYEIYVAQINWFGCDYNNAIKIIEEVEYIKDSSLSTYKDLNIASMEILSGNYDKGDIVLNKIQGNGTLDIYIRGVGEYSKFVQGKEVDYSQMPSRVPEDENKYILKVFHKILEFEDILVKKEKNNTGGTLKGKIYDSDGNTQGIVIVLSSNIGVSSGGLLCNVGSNPFAVADINGGFEINDIPPGQYELVIEVPKNRVYGKTISFHKKFERAFEIKEGSKEKLDIHLLNSIKVKDISKSNGNTIKIEWENDDININEPRITLGLIVEGFDGRKTVKSNLMWECVVDEYGQDYASIDIDRTIENYVPMVGAIIAGRKIEPEQLFYPFKINGEYTFRIETSRNDNNVYLGEYEGIVYNGQYKAFNIEDNVMLKGDMLLLDKKYDEAIKWFEGRLSENPKDIRSLEVLYPIYDFGYDAYMDQENRTEYSGKNKKKAQEYLKRLIELNKKQYYLDRLSEEF